MQKLSYRDKVIVVVFLVIAILVAGFMLLIKPKYEDIKTEKSEIETAQAEWNDLESKISQINTIKKRIETKYNESVELGNFFVDVKRSYTLEKFIQDYIDRNGIYIKTSAAFSDPTLSTLMPYTLTESVLDYDINQSADLNASSDENNSDNSGSDDITYQSLPYGTITIDFNATRAGLMQFMQDIKTCGKTIEIKSLTIEENSYNTAPESVLTGTMSIDVYYAAMISDLDVAEEMKAAE